MIGRTRRLGRIRNALALVLAIVAIVAGCGVLTRTFDVVFPDRGHAALPVTVRDETGLIASVRVLDPDEQGGLPFAWDDGVTNLGNDQTTLAYAWVGGACDSRTTITFRPAGAGLELVRKTEVTGDACIMIGIGRALVFKLTALVPAARVSVSATP